MSTTLLDIKNKITYWVDDLDKGYFTDTQLTRFINDAQFEVQKLLLQSGSNYFLTAAETTLVVGQKEYVFPSDFLHLHRLEVITSNNGTVNETTQPLQFITLNQQDNIPIGQYGTPLCYTLKADRVLIFPAPDTAYPLRLTYAYRVPLLVNNSDSLSIPDEYCEMVAIMAAIDCYIKDGRDASLLVAKQKGYEEMMKKEAEDRHNDSPRRVVSQGDGSFGVVF